MLVHGTQIWREKRQLHLIDTMKKRIHCLEIRNVRKQRLAKIQANMSARRLDIRQQMQKHKEKVQQSLRKLKQPAKVQTTERKHLQEVVSRLKTPASSQPSYREMKMVNAKNLERKKQLDLQFNKSKRAKIRLQLQSAKSRIAQFWETRKSSISEGRSRKMQQSESYLNQLERDLINPMMKREDDLRKQISGRSQKRRPGPLKRSLSISTRRSKNLF